MSKKDCPGEPNLTEQLLASAQEMWLAGLNAFEQAEKEGSRLVEPLIEERLLRMLTALGVPSRETIEALTQRVAELDAAVSALQSLHPPPPDDLQAINSIGKALAQRLRAQGVVSFRQIALWSEAEIDAMEQALSGQRFSPRIRRNQWRAQAKEQHWRKYGERL